MSSLYPLILFASAHVFCFLALVAKPSPYRRLYMIPITLATVLFYRSAFSYPSLVIVSWSTLFSTLVLQLLIASDYILLTDVQREVSIKTQKRPVSERPLFERVKWAARLYINPRCIGWSHEPGCLPQAGSSPTTTRLKFALFQLLRLARDVALYGVTTLYVTIHPSFTRKGSSIADNGILWLSVNVIVFWIRAYTQLNVLHGLTGLVSVTVGFVKPRNWRPAFGSLADAYSLRNFWGRFWHQFFRRPLSSHGRYFTYKVLGLKKNTFTSYMMQVYIGFALSGLIYVGHEFGRPACWDTMRYFLLQAVGIHIESLVTSRFSFPKSWSWMGYLWVFAWFLYSVPYRVKGMVPTDV